MSTNSSVPDNAAKHAEPVLLRGRALSVSLTVKDLPKSLAWYRDVMGFTIDRKMEREGKLRAVALKAGDVQISINQDDGAKGWDGPERRRDREADQGARWHPGLGAR
jgi:catechol 2,3-dioxygenase-like lactoylglutathione lyase family enzyme